MENEMSRRQIFILRKLIVPAAAMVVLWGMAAMVGRSSDGLIPALLLVAAGIAAVAGVVLFVVLPKGRRSPARRLASFAIGTLLFGAAILTQHNVQIEGLFFGLLAGVLQGAVLHYLIAKIAGPLLFGRVWCGWACWFGAVLDLLPYRRGDRLRGGWGWLRYAHFAISLALVALLWFGFGQRQGALGAAAVAWFAAGSLLYYLIGIALALALKDNRAFCKYLCPIAVPLKLTSRFALLKVAGDHLDRCDHDEACVKVCPMDVRVVDYIMSGERVLSTECILCQECITVCDQGVLKLSFGLDMGGKDLLVERSS
jgi:ferredoxin-type protein NapH